MDNYKSIVRQIVKVGLPITIQSIVLSLVQLVDNLFIGHLSNATDVSAGINAVSNFNFILRTLIGGFVGGVGVYFAQASSTKNTNIEKQFFRTKFLWGIGLCLIILPFATIFLKDISKLWIASGPKQELAAGYAFDYGQYVIPTMIIDILVVIFASSYVQRKNTKLTMIVAIIAIIVNSSLNYPFMYLLNMGVKGSAIATSIARVVELIIWVVYIIITKPSFIGRIKYLFTINLKELFVVFPKASMWTLNAFLGSLAFTIQILFLSRISNDAGAALVLAGTVSQIIFALVGGYSQAIWIIISHEVTKNDSRYFKRVVDKLAISSIAFGLCAGILLSSTAPLIALIYPNYLDSTITSAKIMIFALGVATIYRIVAGVHMGALKSCGYAKSLVFMDSIYSWVVLVLLTLLLTQLKVDMDFGWIYFIVRIAELPKTIIIWMVFQKNWRKLKPIIQLDDKEKETSKVSNATS